MSTATALRDHSSTHLFSCNHCSFQSPSRLECLIHKRDSHPSTTDELAGFEDLDHPTLVLKTARVPRFVGTTLLPPASSNTRPSASQPARTVGMSLVGTVGSITRPVSSSTCMSSSSSNVLRTVSGKTGDSYFTYRIAHDTDGRVQSYECDICAFRSVQISDMFTHASTHSLADLAKSGAATVNNVIWECFYCPFSAPLQASVVSHVIASHPNQPIQLKRLPTTPAAVASKTLSKSTNSVAGSSSSQVSLLPSEQPASDETATTPVSSAANRLTKPADLKAEKKKKSDVSDEGCIWGCYYCTMQSASRNDIIGHLKKQHSSEKLVITRRRITHVATGTSATVSKPSPSMTAAVSCSDQGKLASDSSVTSPMSESEVSCGDSTRVDDGDGTSVMTKSRKRPLSPPASTELQQPLTTDSSESVDGNLSVVGGKSRRKQTAPRRVADELAAAAAAAAIAAGADKLNENSPLAAGDALTDLTAIPCTTTAHTLPTAASTAVGAASSRSLLATSSAPRRHGRSSMSKYDSLIKKLKMADSEENGMEMAGLLDKPRLEEPVKTSSSSKSSQGKALSLLTGQLVSGYVQPPTSSMATLTSSSRDSIAPVVNCESNPAKRRRPSSGLKVSIVQYVERKKKADHGQCYVYDSERQTARCGVCGTTACGSQVLRQIREHVAAHFNACRWACVYCAFQCSRRAVIVAHVTQRHHDRPLRLICRRPYHSNSRTASNSAPQQLTSTSTDVGARQKLRGPRCHRDQRHISLASVLWQCAFCSRRSLFHGRIVIHMKLAHFDHYDDLRPAPQRWLRPPNMRYAASQDDDLKQAQVCLVRIEDVDRYPSLSDVILSNGADLIRELDADDEDEVVMGTENVADGNNDVAEFRCIYCHLRAMTPAVVKCHILETHQLEDITVLDLRSSRRLNHEHLFMCRSVECQFMSSIEKEFLAHIDACPSHSTNGVVTVPHSEPKPVDHPRHVSSESRNINKTLASDMSAVTPARTAVAGSAKSRRGTDGPIEYNDDGTMRGLELGSRASNMKIQCTHCCTVMCCDVSEMRSHLSSAHPRLVPLAIDVERTDTTLPASLFLCLIAHCDFVTSYYNVYKHHMDEEHPDSEAGSASRRHCLSSTIKRRSAPSVHRSSKSDRSFTARRPKKPASVLNSSVDNGHQLSSTSCDEASFLASADDVDVSHRKPASHSSHYSSQGFDFSRRYKCVLCSHTAATLADMKSHLTSCHDSTTAHQCVDRRARQLRKRQGVYFCPDPNCAFCCKFDDELAVHVDQEHPAMVGTSQPKSCGSEDGGCAGDRVYQCAHCTYITTDLRNVRVHVVAEHATTEGGFAEIKTGVSSDGSLIMNVNDAISSKSAFAGDHRSVLENGDKLAAGSGSNVKVDDEGKVFAVL